MYFDAERELLCVVDSSGNLQMLGVSTKHRVRTHIIELQDIEPNRNDFGYAELTREALTKGLSPQAQLKYALQFSEKPKVRIVKTRLALRPKAHLIVKKAGG